MERTIINAFGLYLPPLSLVHWKKVELYTFQQSYLTFHMHMHAPWTYCNAWEFKCSQVAYLLIWSRASANHLYLHLQRLFLGISYDCAALSHRRYRRADKWIYHHKHDHTNNHLNVVSACQKIWACNSNDFGLLGKSALATGGHYSKNKWTTNQITKI